MDTSVCKSIWPAGAGALLAAALAGPVAGQVTTRVSIAVGGAQGNGDSEYPAISADGRYVAFQSNASNLVGGDTNGVPDVFVRDRQSGTTERVSVNSSGAQGNESSGEYGLAISADGRYVAFESFARNLVAGDTNRMFDVFVRDRLNGTTERVSVDSNGVQGNDYSGVYGLAISADGRYVAFASTATNLVSGDTNVRPDVFVHDRQTGATERVSVGSGGVQANGFSEYPSISADGRFVAFHSSAYNLVAGETNGAYDVFVRDRQNGATERVSVATGGTQGNSDSLFPSISADGSYVAFTSYATNLVAGDTNGAYDVFVRDRQTGTTLRVSDASGGAQGDATSFSPSISANGDYVAFTSYAMNLVAGDTNGTYDVFLHQRQIDATERVSVATGGAEANGSSALPSISADDRYVAFASTATNLVSGDTNILTDVFVYDREATGFSSLCDPGVAGVQACPCSNPPAGNGQGCDNSAATGGAILFTSGVSYLSMDSLVFTTSGERPTAFGILLQGTTWAPAGIAYGQGVRCVGGSLKRLYTKTASAGSITAPDFGAGDPTVSARSAAKGDTILAGQSRWYLVFYRDPTVLGGCPANSTFNATQTGRVAWQL